MIRTNDLDVMVKAVEIIEEHPEYIISGLGEPLVASDDAPEEVKKYCIWKNTKNRIVHRHYEKN